MSFNFALYQLAPTILQIVIRREIAGEKERHVARIGPRHIILDGGKVNLFDVLQHWRQRSADLFVDLVSATIKLVFRFIRRVSQLVENISRFLSPVELTQIVQMRLDLHGRAADLLAPRSGAR